MPFSLVDAIYYQNNLIKYATSFHIFINKIMKHYIDKYNNVWYNIYTINYKGENTMKKLFVASDGTQFINEEDCKRYEALLAKLGETSDCDCECDDKCDCSNKSVPTPTLDSMINDMMNAMKKNKEEDTTTRNQNVSYIVFDVDGNTVPYELLSKPEQRRPVKFIKILNQEGVATAIRELYEAGVNVSGFYSSGYYVYNKELGTWLNFNELEAIIEDFDNVAKSLKKCKKAMNNFINS